MGRFTIKIAERVAAVTAIYSYTRHFCADYKSQENPDFSVVITEEDIEFEREITARERALEGLPEQDIAPGYLECTSLQRKIAEKLFSYDVLLFHGSVIAVDGVAYLFTAQSGTGKSTHTRLWREMLGDKAVMVNDDKPFLRIMEDGVRVCGSPWNGKHKLGTNIDVSLKAICILERGEENEIHRISPNEALLMLLQQSSRPQNPGLLPKYMELLDKLANKTAFYRLACNMDPSAAELSYRTMSSAAK